MVRRALLLTLGDESTANSRHHRIARTYYSHTAADALATQLNQAWHREHAKASRNIGQYVSRDAHHDELTMLLARPSATMPCQQAAALNGYLSAFGTFDYPGGPQDLSNLLLVARDLLAHPAFPLEIAARAQWLEFGAQPGEQALARLGVAPDVAQGMSISYDSDGDCFLGVSVPALPDLPSHLRPIGSPAGEVRHEARRYPQENLRVWVIPDDPADPDHVGVMANLALLAGQQPGVRSILVLPRNTQAMADPNYREQVAGLIARSSQQADYYAKPQWEPGIGDWPPVALVTGSAWADRIPELAAVLRGERRPNLRAKPGLQTLRAVPTTAAGTPERAVQLLHGLKREATRERRRQRLERGAEAARGAARAVNEFIGGERSAPGKPATRGRRRGKR